MNRQLNKSEPERILPWLVILFPCIFILFFASTCRKETPAPAKEETATTPKEELTEPAKVVFRSALAGRWYSADAQTLRKQIDGFYQKADVKPIDNVIAFILPHAGYRYSGQIAVMGLKKTAAKYKRIVVIGPTHSMPMEEILSVPRVTHYETLLGEIPLDVEFINKLLEHPLFRSVPQAHADEHSVQIELPLLQHTQKDFKLVPIVAGRCSLETVKKAGAILKGLVDEQTLVVASSDFVHYGPNFNYIPFTDNIPEGIKKLDMGAYEHIARLDSKGFLEYKNKTGATICGYIPVAILLSMMDKPVKAELVKYATSGEMTGDFTSSVSYLSVVFTGAWQDSPEIKPQVRGGELTEKDKRELLTLARKTIDYGLRNQRVPEASELGVTISEAMKRPRAAFVTLKKISVLKKDDEAEPQKILRLRGCIGDIFPQRPLYKSVLMNAIYAAFSDRRFTPLQKDEFDDIVIEISALTAPKPARLNQIRIGIDGVVLRKEGKSAVFLPQVAPEQGWDLEQTLTHLSQKAGLPEDAWKEGASFLVFEGDVFGENHE